MQLKDVTITPSTFSDHDYVDLDFKCFDPNSFQYGPGFWKCNVSILEDQQLINEITEVWQEHLGKIEPKDGNWWEYCKGEFKNIIVDHSKRISTEFKKEDI